MQIKQEQQRLDKMQKEQNERRQQMISALS